jgi:hypothetical protein
MSVVAGQGEIVSGWWDGHAREARFWGPLGIAINKDGHIYVSDQGKQEYMLRALMCFAFHSFIAMVSIIISIAPGGCIRLIAAANGASVAPQRALITSVSMKM